jgi:FkbM family methyltransferase
MSERRLFAQLKSYQWQLVHKLRVLFLAPFLYSNFIYFFLGRFRKRLGELRLRNGLVFQIDPRSSDRATVTEMFLDKPYTNQSGYEIAPNDVVLDAGANIGAYAIYAASCFPTVSVFALEPVKELHTRLAHNVRLNGLTNVRTFPLALGPTNGSQTISVSGSGSSVMWEMASGKSEVVQSRTFADFMGMAGLNRIDVLKMDIEGAEFDVFATLSPELLHRIHRITMEFHHVSEEKNARVLETQLKANGFRIDVLRGDWNGVLLATNLRFPKVANSERASASQS